MRLWSDDPCDRTEGHKGLSEVFREMYGLDIGEWKLKSSYFDGGDSMHWLGFVDLGEYLKRVEVVVACDGNEIRELS